MKKLILGDHHRWLKVKRRRREIVLSRSEKFKSIHQEIIVNAPTILSISMNPSGTINFFDEFKSAVFTKKKIQKRGRWKTASAYIDLSRITRISVPAAVILSAELDRWRRLQNTHLRARNLSSWEPRVKSLLADLGCFELVGAQRVYPTTQKYQENITVLKLRSGEKSNGQELQQLQLDLSRIFQAFVANPKIYQGLLEAANNCIDHAYPDMGAIRPKYSYAGHRWWATACVDMRNNSLRFFIYDQGVGIPRTIGEKADWRQALSKIPGISMSNDATTIDGAFEIGRTSTGIDGRGRGLNQMREATEIADNAYIRIVSGKGDVKYNCSRNSEKQQLPAHIGGTLVEWSIPIDAF